jgi:Tetratricopeptide repeat
VPGALLIGVAQNTKPIEELRVSDRSTHALSRNESNLTKFERRMLSTSNTLLPAGTRTSWPPGFMKLSRNAYLLEDRYADAESLFRRTIQMTEDTFGPDHPKLVPYIELWVPGLRHLGKTDEADELEALADKIRGAQKH